jgi:hypothetical protein
VSVIKLPCTAGASLRFPSTPGSKESLLRSSPSNAWQLPVTESLHSRHKKAVRMAGIQKFDLREGLIGPILVSISLSLMIAGAVIIRW